MGTNLAKVKDKIFENIFSHASNGIAIVALDFRWVKVNQSLMDLLGYSEDEFYNMTFNDITHKEDLQKDMLQMSRLIDGEIEDYKIEKRYFHKTGKIIWVLLSVSMQTDELGNPMYFITQIMEITKQKEMLLEMYAISEIVRAQNEKLLNFAHIATHDIRSHVGNLGAITGFMEDENFNIKHDPNFKMLKDALAQLENTITNLNEVRKSEFSTPKNLRVLSLNEFVENVIYNVNAIARHENCQIINEVDQDFHVQGIPGYLESVILNLLTNAIKYSSRDRSSFVKLRAVQQNGFVVLEVTDNGLGIDLNKHRNNMFQLEKTFHGHKDARGVGLFITRNHIEDMGGKIEVESQVDVGSTFRVFLQETRPNTVLKKCQ